MSEFLDIVRKRRSANKFLEGISIPKEDFEAIFEDLSLAPSAFNLQHANYYVVTNPDLKREVYEASYMQYKIKTASAVIIVTGDSKAYMEAEEIYQGSRMLGIIDDEEFKATIDMIMDLYEGRGQEFQIEEAIRNASLSAMLFMLLAKDKGWDTCPMINFDNEKMRKLLSIPEAEIPTLMITMGKMDETSFRVRGYRKPSVEFVNYVE